MKQTYLFPVIELIVGQVQLQDMSTECFDVGPVASFADPAVIQNQNAGQEQSVCRPAKLKSISFLPFSISYEVFFCYL